MSANDPIYKQLRWLLERLPTNAATPKETHLLKMMLSCLGMCRVLIGDWDKVSAETRQPMIESALSTIEICIDIAEWMEREKPAAPTSVTEEQPN